MYLHSPFVDVLFRREQFKRLGSGLLNHVLKNELLNKLYISII